MSEEKLSSPSQEEIKLSNKHKLKERELSIAEKRLDWEINSNRYPISVVLLSALLAIIAVLGIWMLVHCACDSSDHEGCTDLCGHPNPAITLDLARVQFSNDIVNSALSATNPANSMKFYADIGLLNGLKVDEIKKYAADELDRLAEKQEGASLLPVFYKPNSSTELPNLVGLDGQVCVGQIDLSVGLVEVQSPGLLSQALRSSGNGGLCFGKVFSVTLPIAVYRVYNSSNPKTKLGNWWALSPPVGSKEDYRVANAICPGWSTLDRLIKCELKPGAEVVVGTTQSVDCSGGPAYPKTGENQVYIANSGEDEIYHVGACTEKAIC